MSKECLRLLNETEREIRSAVCVTDYGLSVEVDKESCRDILKLVIEDMREWNKERWDYVQDVRFAEFDKDLNAFAKDRGIE